MLWTWPMTGPAFENVYYKNNVAQGVTMQSNYMGVGGTNWGWLPAPVVYTSYDYGAAWNEARQARVDKTAPMKAMGYMVQSVAPMAKMDKVRTERYPSATELDRIEDAIPNDMLGEYLQVLLDKIRDDRFPSVWFVRRIERAREIDA